MAAQIFGGGMENHVHAHSNGLLQIRCGKGVVKAHQRAVLVCQSADGFDVYQAQQRIAGRF